MSFSSRPGPLLQKPFGFSPEGLSLGVFSQYLIISLENTREVGIVRGCRCAFPCPESDCTKVPHSKKMSGWSFSRVDLSSSIGGLFLCLRFSFFERSLNTPKNSGVICQYNNIPHLVLFIITNTFEKLRSHGDYAVSANSFRLSCLQPRNGGMKFGSARSSGMKYLCGLMRNDVWEASLEGMHACFLPPRGAPSSHCLGLTIALV